MADLKNKRIITAAVTGAWPKKENNPNVPLTPAEISEDVYACWKAGAAVAHLHMRDDNGNGTMDFALENHEAFRDRCLTEMSERFRDGDNYAWICFKGGSHAYNCWLPHLYNSMLVFFK